MSVSLLVCGGGGGGAAAAAATVAVADVAVAVAAAAATRESACERLESQRRRSKGRRGKNKKRVCRHYRSALWECVRERAREQQPERASVSERKIERGRARARVNVWERMLKNNNTNTGCGDCSSERSRQRRSALFVTAVCVARFVCGCLCVSLCVCELLRKKVVKNNCGKPKKAQKTENENAATTTRRRRRRQQQRPQQRKDKNFNANKGSDDGVGGGVAAEAGERGEEREGGYWLTLSPRYPFLSYAMFCTPSSLAFFAALRSFLLIRFFFDSFQFLSLLPHFVSFQF